MSNVIPISEDRLGLEMPPTYNIAEFTLTPDDPGEACHTGSRDGGNWDVVTLGTDRWKGLTLSRSLCEVDHRRRRWWAGWGQRLRKMKVRSAFIGEVCLPVFGDGRRVSARFPGGRVHKIRGWTLLLIFFGPLSCSSPDSMVAFPLVDRF